MNWNWDHIRFFLALADKKTLTHAADLLNVSHSTVLRRVKSLEEELDTRLFEQSNDGYRMTMTGEGLYRECTEIQERLQSALHRASGVDHRIAGKIVITTSDTLAVYLMPPVLKRIQKNYPSLHFHLLVNNQISNMDDRKADIAIRPCKVPPEHLIGRKIGELKFSVVASKNYAISHNLTELPQRTENHQFIVLDSRYSDLPFYRLIEDSLHECTTRTTVNNFTNAISMVRAGMGISVIPSYVLHHEPHLVELSTPTQIPSNELWVLSHPDLRNTDRIKLVKKSIISELETCFSSAPSNSALSN